LFDPPTNPRYSQGLDQITIENPRILCGMGKTLTTLLKVQALAEKRRRDITTFDHKHIINYQTQCSR